MKKFEGILFATDLDGTLVRNDKSISEENLKAIQYFMAEGGLFTFVTGRAPIGAVGIYNIVKPNAPCGCLNGGSIYDFNKQQILWCIEISRRVLGLVEYVDEKLPDIGIEVHTHTNIYFCKQNESTEKHKSDENLPDLYCHYNDIDEPVAKILLAVKSSEDLPELIEVLKSHTLYDEFDFIRSDERFYEILPKGASKGKLVGKIAEMFNVNPDKIIAVGDNDNDASMLQNAGMSFAVANASECAKQSADYITVSNEEDAIANIIYNLDKI